jgi:DNA-binding NarL/FixJ family response regulator
MVDLEQVKVTPRPAGVESAGPGIEQHEIAGQLNISPRTVKQHLRTLFLRAGIRDGRKPAKTGHRHPRQAGNAVRIPRERRAPKEIQVAILLWQGLTNREIGKIIGTTEPVTKNHLRSTFDKVGVWSRLELAM